MVINTIIIKNAASFLVILFIIKEPPYLILIAGFPAIDILFEYLTPSIE